MKPDFSAKRMLEVAKIQARETEQQIRTLKSDLKSWQRSVKYWTKVNEKNNRSTPPKL